MSRVGQGIRLDECYKLLQISRSATSEDAKAAYRRLARRYHPDLNPDPTAAERFKAINAAYERLAEHLVTRPRQGVRSVAQPAAKQPSGAKGEWFQDRAYNSFADAVLGSLSR